MLNLQESNTKPKTGDSHSRLHHIDALHKLKSAEKDRAGEEKLKLYAEAVDAIQRVLEDTSDLKSDKPKLKLIVNSLMQ